MEKINNVTYTNQKETQDIKQNLFLASKGICPLLGKRFAIDKMVADHQHKLKAEPCTTWEEGGKGLIRGTIEFRANALEGKIVNNWSRLGLAKDYDLPTYLRNLADYLENPPAAKLSECYAYYSEKPKRIKVKISEYKRVAKYYLELHPRKRTIIKKPVYVTDKWLALLQLTNDHIDKINFEKAERKRIRLENKNR
jgi:hypothetical protein